MTLATRLFGHAGEEALDRALHARFVRLLPTTSMSPVRGRGPQRDGCGLNLTPSRCGLRGSCATPGRS